jgi:hypothetical protein
MKFKEALGIIIDAAFDAADANCGPCDISTEDYRQLVDKAAKIVAKELGLEEELGFYGHRII